MSSIVRDRAWKICTVCPQTIIFKTPTEFSCHLREYHCSREGGSFVCKYGFNNVCASLPVLGVSDEDYENHVAKHHTRHQISADSSRSSHVTRKMSPSSYDQPNVVSEPGKWTFYSSTQNLPAVLNDPGRGKQKDFFSKTWGDSFVETSSIPRSPFLPEITRAHFESYLKRTSKRYRKHVRRCSSLPKAIAGQEAHIFPSFQATKQLAEKSRVDLDNIPKIFLQPNFNLENLETFNAVFPWSHLQPPRAIVKGGGKEHNSSKLLQEKLSHYLDIVEVQIAHQISLKSAAFFSAMTSHDALMEQLTETVLAVKRLRDRIHHIDDILVKGSLRILHLKCLRHNYVSVYDKLKLMATVHQTQPTIQLLLSSSEFVGALDLISTTQEVLAQELAGIHSFRHLGSQLAELEKLIDKMMQADFVRYATADLNRPLTDCQPVMEEDRLVAIVFGMMHQRRYNFVEVYKEETFTTIKTIIKQTVIEVISQVDSVYVEGNLGSLPDQVKLLGFVDWLDLMKAVFLNLLKLLHRVKAVHGVMSDAVDIAGGKAVSPTTPKALSLGAPEVANMNVTVDDEAGVTIPDVDHRRLVISLKELLTAVCDNSHDRCAKLLAAKAKDGFLEKLNSAEFVMLSKCIENFVADCEEICGKKSTSLRLGLQSQANRFVNRFHEERKTKLSLILDNELWKQAGVPAEFQDIVDHVTSTGSLTIQKKSSDSDIVEQKKAQDFLSVSGEKYAVVGTVLLLLKMIVEYCQCVTDIPSISSDLLTRLVELLKTFNSRTCQLVLGAGALQLVGLKTITTKNLALASRCLQLILRYIPQIKAHFEEKLPGKQQSMSKHFDQVSKDYQDHIQEIVNKLVAIIDGMFDSNLDKWEVKPPVPSNHFRAICKQLAKLHEAIADLLPPDQIRDLFSQIHTAFVGKVRQQLQILNVVNDGGPRHGLVTSELAFYLQSLKSLNCFKEDEVVLDVWGRR